MMENSKRKYWFGVAMGSLTGLFGVLLVPAFLELVRSIAGQTGSAFFSFSLAMGIPLAMGAVAAFFWHRGGLKSNVHVLGSFHIFLFALFGGAVVLREGAVCLVMAFPLLWFSIFLGSFIARSLLDRYHKSFFSLVLPLYALMILGDVLSPQNFHNAVSSTVVINAPPQVVWRYVGEFPAITEPARHWIFRLGVPPPVQSRLQGAGVGARRECELAGPIVIEEKITAWQPHKKLAFDITRQPNHPEMVGHITLQHGQFDLTDNGNGTTTLTGTSRYRLHMYPAAYFDWWTQQVVHAVHWRVFEHVKRLAESDAGHLR